MKNHYRFYVHGFSSVADIPFSMKEYSLLKFGSDRIAKKFGCHLADELYAKYAGQLLSRQAVVIPSPYNVVKNAATIMTEHFVNRLNYHLVNNGGMHVDCSLIHRKVSYVNDYGFLPEATRRALLSNDSFYINKDFVRDKILIFVDDVNITGTHEDKLKEIITRENLDNMSFFIYYGKYYGSSPDIESKLNFAAIDDIDDLLDIMSEESKYHVIIRPIKYIMSLDDQRFNHFLMNASGVIIEEVYHGCLSEGYYTNPKFMPNFTTLQDFIKNQVDIEV